MIYVLGEVNSDGTMSPYVKVGFVKGEDEYALAYQLKERVNKLQVGNPRKLVVIGKTTGDRVREKALHHMFASARVRRPQVTEWLVLEEGSAFTAWVESVRCETMTFGTKAGVGSRGGLVYVKGANRCSHCKSTEHTSPRCQDKRDRVIDELRQEVANLRTRATPRTRLDPNAWEWRGRVRVS